MREIKFRAWTNGWMGRGPSSKMIYSGDLADHYDSESAIDFYPIKEGDTLMQYINQKDSEGTKIYEGDVVTWYNPMIETGERMTGVVVYDTKQATYKKCPINLYKANAGNGGYTGYEFRWYDNVKVLGNIHENPELLQN
ncbi:hypothetical protein COE15_01055 [Bacillus cereus]|uniref:YopX family protein n=1 Tax=unclassified Bacillus (in: firmicutes) TaxID=185979 RepID=UPI00089CE949|nr:MULTISPECIES: YopX family protein [unclassified Bacillus (in: firmicutes)]PFD94733.1 hypothetical protein CN288_27140 [Bacillus sp. AFS023182]PGY05333.1 hypothetical protein COE15_01055 [Bacillus cereus]SDY76663.1 phage uncharacterized protein TIGR01671 [Bacillus sp. 166amftsu]